MKKILLALMLCSSPLVAEPTVDVKNAVNEFTWAQIITASVDTVWQVWNPTSNVSGKTIYVKEAVVTSNNGGYFVAMTTNAPNAFNGSRSNGDVQTAILNNGNVSASSCTFATAFQTPSGSTVAYASVAASDTTKIIDVNAPFALKPGNALYIIKANNGTNDRSTVTFRLLESYR